MTAYRIVCTVQEPVTQPTTHAHIVAVGTGTNPQTYSQRWTLAQVIAAMDRGDTFYTQGVTSGKTARVEKYTCPKCRGTHIRSASDAVQDNNLDNLPRCGS
mgnify:CR=1 FL=1